VGHEPAPARQHTRDLGTIAELLPDDRELLFGLGSGISQARWVERPKPIRFVRETLQMSRALLAGETVQLAAYPLLTEYFHLKDTAARMSVPLTRPEAVSFWFSPQGPLGNKLAAEVVDGIFIEAGTTLGLAALRDGTLETTIQDIEQLRAKAGITRPLRRIMGLCVSVSRDRDAAFERARMHAAVAAERHRAAVGPGRELTEEALQEMFLVGTPEEVGERLIACMEDAERFGCEHICLGVPTGPHPLEAVELAGQVVVPLVKGRTATSGA
jgi:alkanesulfonate monooxygenase SsuD/methylene tetrahydromethanopterin reductase-like flavin-dependent oxidoreductase (luciferase family)